MTERDVLEAGRLCLMATIQLILPILVFSLVAGVMVSIFQAVTHIQEFTLTFVPKLVAAIVAFAIFGSWMLSLAINYMVNTFTHMPPITN